MKKILACTLALIAAASLSTGVLAADKPPGFLAVTSQVGMLWSRLAQNNGEDSYVVTIPGQITIVNSGTPAPFGVEASSVFIAPGRRLAVRLASCNNFVLKMGGSSVSYICRLGGNEIDENTVILSVSGEGAEVASSGLNNSLSLSASPKASGKVPSGTHTDTITFRCTVESTAD